MDKEMLKEKVMHGDDNFPIGIHKTDIDKGRDNILYLHWHEGFEYLTVTKGRAVFRVDDLEIEVSKGEGIFINSNVLHSAYSINEEECSFFAVVCHPAFLSSYINDCINQRFINPILNNSLYFPIHLKKDVDWQRSILLLLTQVYNINKEKEFGYELLLKSKIYEIWFECIKNTKKSINKVSNTSYKTERMKIVLNYIHENYFNKIVVSELASLVHMSDEHFCRFFKAMTNFTLVSYVNRYRIERSCVFLSRTNKKISEIAGDVGFGDISYFNKVFRKIMGCTPVDYRSSQ